MAIIINFVFCTAIFLLAVVKSILYGAMVMLTALIYGRNIRATFASVVHVVAQGTKDCFIQWKEDIA